jgi:hypothetical protein
MTMNKATHAAPPMTPTTALPHFVRPSMNTTNTATTIQASVSAKARKSSTARAVLLGLLVLGLHTSGSAQQGVLLGAGEGQWLTSAGAVCNGCKLNFYIAGTSTRLDTYAAADLATPNANPVVLSSAGRAEIWLSDRAYKIVLTTSADVEIWSVDNYTGRNPPSNVLSKTTNYTVTTSDGKDVLVKSDASGAAFTVTLYTSVANSGRIVRVVKTDTSANVVTVDANGAETINGQTTIALTVRYDTVSLISDGTGWFVLNEFARTAVVSKSSNYTITADDDFVIATSTPTLTLYTAVGNTGKQVRIKNSGTGVVTLDGNASETVHGTVTAPLFPGEDVLLTSDGSNWLTNLPSVRLIDRDVAALTVANSTTETTVYTFSVPANTLGSNRMLRLTILADYLNNSGSSSNFDIAVKWGGSTMLGPSLGSQSTSAVRRRFQTAAVIAANNATNAQIVSGVLNFTNPATDAAWTVRSTGDDKNAANSATADTTAAQTLSVTVQHGTAAATIDFRCLQVFLEVVG